MTPNRTAGQTHAGGLSASGAGIAHAVPHTILLLEPDLARAGQIRRALTGPATSCLRVEWVATLPDALQCLGRAEIEAVLLDTRLCAGDGIDLLNRVRQVKPDVLVLLMTRPGIVPAPEHTDGSDADSDHFGLRNIQAPWLPGTPWVLGTLRRGTEAERLQRPASEVALTS